MGIKLQRESPVLHTFRRRGGRERDKDSTVEMGLSVNPPMLHPWTTTSPHPYDSMALVIALSSGMARECSADGIVGTALRQGLGERGQTKAYQGST
jgi:hypothetical protein